MTEGRISRLGWHARRAGTTLLRTSGSNQIWCQCAGGRSHGWLSLAAHAHADALSVEVRYAGVDILADLGAFCYSGEGGPFRWVRSAHTREIEILDDGDIARWTAEHDGHALLDPSALHRRSVLLDRASRSIDIVDQIEGSSQDIYPAFRLGPDVQAELEESCAVLAWPTASPPGAARLELPPGLRWSLHRGGIDPILGWYSPDLSRRVHAVTLLGRGRCVPGMPLITRLEFVEVGKLG